LPYYRFRYGKQEFHPKGMNQIDGVQDKKISGIFSAKREETREKSDLRNEMLCNVRIPLRHQILLG
jgi:hypothetical protein